MQGLYGMSITLSESRIWVLMHFVKQIGCNNMFIICSNLFADIVKF